MAEAEAAASGPEQSSGDTDVLSVNNALVAPTAGDILARQQPSQATREAIQAFTPEEGHRVVVGEEKCPSPLQVGCRHRDYRHRCRG